MNRWILFLVLFTTQLNAESLRVRVHLNWEHVPRPPNVASKQKAEVPGGVVLYSRAPSGVRSFSIGFNAGFHCTTSGAPTEMIILQCGTPEGSYKLTQYPGKTAELDWVYDGTVIPPGDGL